MLRHHSINVYKEYFFFFFNISFKFGIHSKAYTFEKYTGDENLKIYIYQMGLKIFFKSYFLHFKKSHKKKRGGVLALA